jgi:hypothetical protein
LTALELSKGANVITPWEHRRSLTYLFVALPSSYNSAAGNGFALLVVQSRREVQERRRSEKIGLNAPAPLVEKHQSNRQEVIEVM